MAPLTDRQRERVVEMEGERERRRYEEVQGVDPLKGHHQDTHTHTLNKAHICFSLQMAIKRLLHPATEPPVLLDLIRVTAHTH